MSIHAVRAFGLLYKHTFHKKVRIKYIISSTAKFSRDRNHNQSISIKQSLMEWKRATILKLD